MAFVVFGKKTVGERGTPQVIRFKDLEVRTNSVLMLFIVSAVVAALPLVLIHRFFLFTTVTTETKPEPRAEKHPLYITGYAHKPDGTPLEGTRILLFKLGRDGSSERVAEMLAESDGSFATSQFIDEEHRLKVSATMPGYVNQTLILGVDSLEYPPVLVQKR